jgi:hypothetical protein
MIKHHVKAMSLILQIPALKKNLQIPVLKKNLQIPCKKDNAVGSLKIYNNNRRQQSLYNDKVLNQVIIKI